MLQLFQPLSLQPAGFLDNSILHLDFCMLFPLLLEFLLAAALNRTQILEVLAQSCIALLVLPCELLVLSLLVFVSGRQFHTLASLLPRLPNILSH